MSEQDSKLEEQELPKVNIVDWIFFIPFALSFLGLLVFHDILQRIGILFSIERSDAAMLALGRSTQRALKIVGCRVEIENTCPMEQSIPYIVVSNHQSLFDVPIMYNTLGLCPRFIAKKELGSWLPSASFHLRRPGSALIDRKDSKQALEAIQEAAKIIERDKRSIVIFPEGTRSRNGELRSFRPVGLMALLENIPSAKIVLVTIDGSWKLQCYKRGPIPYGVQIKVKVEPKTLDPKDFKTTRAVVRECEKIISSRLEQLRSSAQ